MDLLHRSVEVSDGLVVDRHEHGAAVGSLTDVVLRMLDHVVDIKRLLEHLGHGVEHGKSKRDVGHEDAVHHVDVEPIGLADIDHFGLALEVEEISGKE